METKYMSSRLHAMRKYHFLLALLVVVFDRFAKWAVDKHIALQQSVAIVPGFFHITHVENRGAAFGLFAESPSEWKITVLVLFSLVALVVVSALLWKNSHTMSTTGVGLALILGGAVGNLWDRLFSGHVVDFLDFYVGSYHWPAFNIADSAIVIGALLLVAEILFSKSPREQNAPTTPTSEVR
jgi:signal peptidase II